MLYNLLSCLLLISFFIVPVWADGSPPFGGSSPTQDTAGKPAPATENPSQSFVPGVSGEAQDVNNTVPNQNKKQAKASLQKKIASVAAAFFIGTPVCMVRRSKYEEWYGVHGMIGDSDSKCKKILARTFWFPFAVIDGTLEAPFDAIANGLMYPAFSKDQLSEGKLVQNN